MVVDSPHLKMDYPIPPARQKSFALVWRDRHFQGLLAAGSHSWTKTSYRWVMCRNRHHKWIETRKPNHRMPVYNRNYQYWKFYFNLFETYRHLFLLRHNMRPDGRSRNVHHGHMCSISDHVFNHRCKILVLPMLRHLVADRIEFICMWTNTIFQNVLREIFNFKEMRFASAEIMLFFQL